MSWEVQFIGRRKNRAYVVAIITYLASMASFTRSRTTAQLKTDPKVHNLIVRGKIHLTISSRYIGAYCSVLFHAPAVDVTVCIQATKRETLPVRGF